MQMKQISGYRKGCANQLRDCKSECLADHFSVVGSAAKARSAAANVGRPFKAGITMGKGYVA